MYLGMVFNVYVFGNCVSCVCVWEWSYLCYVFENGVSCVCVWALCYICADLMGNDFIDSILPFFSDFIRVSQLSEIFRHHSCTWAHLKQSGKKQIFKQRCELHISWVKLCFFLKLLKVTSSYLSEIWIWRNNSLELWLNYGKLLFLHFYLLK